MFEGIDKWKQTDLKWSSPPFLTSLAKSENEVTVTATTDIKEMLDAGADYTGDLLVRSKNINTDSDMNPEWSAVNIHTGSDESIYYAESYIISAHKYLILYFTGEYSSNSYWGSESSFRYARVDTSQGSAKVTDSGYVSLSGVTYEFDYLQIDDDKSMVITSERLDSAKRNEEALTVYLSQKPEKSESGK